MGCHTDFSLIQLAGEFASRLADIPWVSRNISQDLESWKAGMSERMRRRWWKGSVSLRQQGRGGLVKRLVRGRQRIPQLN